MQYYVNEIGSKYIWKYLLYQHKPFWSLPNELDYDWLEKLGLFQISSLYIWFIKWSLMIYSTDYCELCRLTEIFKSITECLYHTWHFGWHILLYYFLFNSVGLFFVLLSFIHLLLALIFFFLFIFCPISQIQIWYSTVLMIDFLYFKLSDIFLPSYSVILYLIFMLPPILL